MITQLRTQSGVVISDEDGVNAEIVNHFTSVFKNQLPTDNQYADQFLDGVRGVFDASPSGNVGMQS